MSESTFSEIWKLAKGLQAAVQRVYVKVEQEGGRSVLNKHRKLPDVVICLLLCYSVHPYGRLKTNKPQSC